MNFLQQVAAYVVGRFTFRAIDNHGMSFVRAIGLCAVVFLVIAWLYS